MRINRFGNKEKLQTIWFEVELMQELEKKLFKEKKTKKEFFLKAIKNYLKED